MKAYIFGAGFSGITVARALAEKGVDVDIFEKNSHIGGNAYDYYDGDILIHKYGPHIFHTNIVNVFQFLSKFTNWKQYEHRVLGYIDGQYVPIPFNLKSLEMLFDEDTAKLIKGILINEYGEGKKVPIMELMKHKNKVISNFGDFVFQKVFYNYTLKQWGMPPEFLPKSVTERVPIYISYDDRYFVDKYQCMPTDGYTRMFERMLNHEKIRLHLNSNTEISFETDDIYIGNERISKDDKVIFTGCIDELLKNKFGVLPYRSLEFKFEKHNISSYQSAAVVNYPNTESYTRISEFTKFTCNENEETVIVKEFPIPHVPNNTISYYPIEREENKQLYSEYEKFVSKYKNFYLIGRLAQYKYINMDIAVNNALALAENICKDM